MKNIFLIGRFNRITQDFNNCLSENYHVQLGSDNSDIIRGMLAMNEPDLVVINLMAMDSSHEAIFRNITEQHPKLPVICVGNREEVKQFDELMKKNQYVRMVRPISNPELLDAVGAIFAKQKSDKDKIAEKADEFVRYGEKADTAKRKNSPRTEKSQPEAEQPIMQAEPARQKELFKIKQETENDDVTLDDYETLKAQIEAMIDLAEEDLSEENAAGEDASKETGNSKPHEKTMSEETQAEPEAKQNPQILLVDDNAIQIRALKGALQKYYDVAMATSGKDAVHMIEKRLPDLVFLDYEMPEWDGKMTLEQIRQIKGAENLPVVFLTGVKNKENIKAVLALNPAGYLLKPANQDMIMNTIQKILGEKR